MGCHPPRWLICFEGVGIPPTSIPCFAEDDFFKFSLQKSTSEATENLRIKSKNLEQQPGAEEKTWYTERAPESMPKSWRPGNMR